MMSEVLYQHPTLLKPSSINLKTKRHHINSELGISDLLTNQRESKKDH